jgi:hypothetical protein
MPKPTPVALRVDGHLVQAGSPDELREKLRLLGERIGFAVSHDLTLTFDHARCVVVEAAEPSPTN